MAQCDVCGKSVQFGCNVSHSHRRTNTMWKANIKKIRVMDNGKVTHKYVCTRCIKAGKIQKAI